MRCQVACVDALRIDETCDVLEIGFGCGYAKSTQSGTQRLQGTERVL